MKYRADNPQTQKVLDSLRPPSARPTALVYPFADEDNFNPGFTLELPEDETYLVSPGDGKIEGYKRIIPFWSHSSSDLAKSVPYQVIIDHGFGVKSVLHGLTRVDVHGGQSVAKGQVIGLRYATQFFCAITLQGQAIDPAKVNRWFQPQNGSMVYGQGNKIKFAPDRIVRDLSTGVRTFFRDTLRYFVPTSTQMLLNVDFNGDGSKTGAAVVGSAGDRWNVVAPADLGAVYTYHCVDRAVSFGTNPQSYLYNAANQLTGVQLIRDVYGNWGGTDPQFDAMLSTYVGGYSGSPRETIIRLDGLPAGSWQLYLYAASASGPYASDFYVSVDGSVPELKQNTPTGVASFVEGNNYVVYNLVVGHGSQVSIQTFGFLAGLQVYRA